MNLIIFGKRSILTNRIKYLEKKSILIENENLKKNNILKKIDKNKNYNIVINSFFPSAHLNNLKTYEEFYEKSLLNLSIFLDLINNFKVQKIIYSSSSAVYNSLNTKLFSENDLNRKIYSSSKIAAENMISNFCAKKKISFINARLFNMYGNDDNFSIISKLIRSFETNKILVINNEGRSIRDFIHVDDIAKIYQILLNKKNFFFGSIDVGTGVGVKISDIINFVGKKKINIKYRKSKINEATNVLANIQNLKNEIGSFKFKSLEKFIKSRLKINSKKIIDKLSYNSSNNIIEDIIHNPIVFGTGVLAKKFYKKQLENEKDIFCFVGKNKSKFCNKEVISENEFKNLSKSKIILKLIIADEKIKKKQQVEIWKKYIKNAKEIYFFNNDNLNIYDQENDIDFSEIITRTEKKRDNSILQKKLFNKTILVTGGAGSIGSEICKQLINFNPKSIIAYDNSEFALYNLITKNSKKITPIIGDINDVSFFENIVRERKVDYIFHAAAYKHVNFLEKNIIQAVKNNVFGSLSVIRVCSKLSINLTIVSTDKAARPKSILGFTKRIAEIIAQKYEKNGAQISVVRFGNVFASKGSAIPYFINQIINEKKITVTDENVKRYFMSISEAADLVIRSTLLKKKPQNIYLLRMGRPIKIFQIIKKLYELLGKKKLIKKNIIFTGLKKGEKIQEDLSFSKKIKQSNIDDIIMVKEPNYKIEQINNLIEKLIKNKLNSNKLNRTMKNFLIEEKN